jgi:uncharacterized protein YegL
MSPRQLPLILEIEQITAWSLFLRRTATPASALVYSTGEGKVEFVEGALPPTWRDRLAGRRRYRYLFQVDTRDHHELVEIDGSALPAQGHAEFFQATLNVNFRVHDPAEIVRRGITDGAPVIYEFLNDACRRITTQFAIEDARNAEMALNEQFSQEVQLPEGITVRSCSARLRPSPDVIDYLRDRHSRPRRSHSAEAEHRESLLHRQRVNELATVDQAGRVERERAEQALLGSRTLSLQEMIRITLERDPGNSHELLQKMIELTREQLAWREQEDARADERLRLLIENHLLQPVDIDVYRNRALAGFPSQGVRMITPPPQIDGWDKPLPGLTPNGNLIARGNDPEVANAIAIYLAVDTSSASGQYIGEVNDGLSLVFGILRALPATAERIRLSVIGYGDDICTDPALLAIGADSRPPRLEPAGSARYGAAFQHLLNSIPRDVSELENGGGLVHRPTVFFLTGTEPGDSDAWSHFHARLVDRAALPCAPDIVAAGIGDVRASTVVHIASSREYGFVSDMDSAAAARNFFSFLVAEIIACGQADRLNEPSIVVGAPEGFQLAAERV